jgi:hypothetical protein
VLHWRSDFQNVYHGGTELDLMPYVSHYHVILTLIRTSSAYALLQIGRRHPTPHPHTYPSRSFNPYEL